MRPRRVVLIHEAARGAGVIRHMQVDVWGFRPVPSAELASVDGHVACVLCDGAVSPAVVEMWIARTGAPVMVVGRILSRRQMRTLRDAGALAVVDEELEGQNAVRDELRMLCSRRRKSHNEKRPADAVVPGARAAQRSVMQVAA